MTKQNNDNTEVVAGLFDTTPQAIRALEDLVSNGYERSDMNLVANDVAGEYNRYFDDEGKYIAGEEDNTTAGEGAAAGGGIGALLGGTGGVLMGLGLLAIPGVGPALAAGPLIAGLVGAGAGALAGGLVGALATAGLPKESAEKYVEGVRRGGTLLLLRTDRGESADQAHKILRAHDPVDLDTRARHWKEAGWTDFEHDAEPLTREELIRERERYTI